MKKIPKYHFHAPVLGKASYTPKGCIERDIGVELTLENSMGEFIVFVPWTNIKFVVQDQR